MPRMDQRNSLFAAFCSKLSADRTPTAKNGREGNRTSNASSIVASHRSSTTFVSYKCQRQAIICFLFSCFSFRYSFSFFLLFFLSKNRNFRKVHHIQYFCSALKNVQIYLFRFSKDMLFFSKNVKICLYFENLFVVSKFVPVFKKIQIFKKVLEFHICSHFSKILRIFHFSCFFLLFFRSPLYFVQKFQILFGISKVFAF